MIKKIKRLGGIVKSKTLFLSKKISFIRPFIVRHQLRYKFSALHYGMIDNRKVSGQLFNLRRNIHRIEKGLSYSNPKSVNNNVDSATQEWSRSVLEKYFSVVDESNEVINQAKQLFYSKADLSTKDQLYFPYTIDNRQESSVSYFDMLNLSLKRRSVRYFERIVIDNNTIEKAFEIAKLAPSACNRQSFRFLYFNDKKIVDQLSKIPGGVSGYELYNLVVVIGDYSGYFNERDINAPIIDASLASMSFLYACETLDLCTVCINWPNLPDRESIIRKVIDIKRSEFVVMMIGVGYASSDGKIPYSKKRSNDDFLLINKRINL